MPLIRRKRLTKKTIGSGIINEGAAKKKKEEITSRPEAKCSESKNTRPLIKR